MKIAARYSPKSPKVSYLAVFFAILVGALALRTALVLNHEGFLGVDGGAYWLSVNAVLGDEPTGAGFPRPPLAPGWLLVPFVELFSFDLGYKLWSVLASLAPIPPVYLLTRRYVGELPALLAAGFIAVDLMHAEMIVTGALPLIGFALIAMAWWAMGGLAERWSWRTAAVLVLSIGLVPWINQTSAGLAVITLPLYLIGLLAFGNMSWLPVARRIVAPAFVGSLIGIGALPWYMKVLPASGLLDYPGPWIFLTGFDAVWLQFVLGLPLGLWVARAAPDYRLRSLGLVMALLAVLNLFLSNDETIINIFYRSGYLLALPFYVGIAWAVTRWVPKIDWARRAVITVGIVAAGALMLAGYVFQFNNQAGYSLMISPATERALETVHRLDPDSGIVTDAFSLSLWIAAMNKVPAPHTWNTAPPPTFTQTDRDVRCVLNWVTGCDVPAATDRLGVGYVLIEERFPYYNERVPGIYLAHPRLWDQTAAAPWLRLVSKEGTTSLWAITR